MNPKKEIKKHPERFETMVEYNRWNDLERLSGYRVKIACADWCFSNLNGVVYFVQYIDKKTYAKFYEIIRRKKEE